MEDVPLPHTHYRPKLVCALLLSTVWCLFGVVCEPEELAQFEELLANAAETYGASTDALDGSNDPTTTDNSESPFGTTAEAGDFVGDAPSPNGSDDPNDNAADPNEAGEEEGDDEALDVAGVYVLNCEGRPLSYLTPFLVNPNLDGFSLRAGWEQVEPSEGNYDWSLFDAVVDYAAEYDKKVMLRIIAGARSPDWVYEAGAYRYTFIDDNPWHDTYGEELSVPIPWDEVYQEKWANLVAVFGERYANHPAVKIVAITGPGHGGEMHLGDKDNEEAWTAMGYTTAAMTQAWIDAIDTFRAAFPNQHLTIGIAHPVSFGAPYQVVAGVADYAAEMGVGLQGNWLSAKLNPEFDLYQCVAAHSEHATVGFQELCSAQRSTFGGALADALDLGYAANACFIEFYASDITVYPEDIAAAHESLCNAEP